MMMPQPRHPKLHPPSKQQRRQHLTTEQHPQNRASVRTSVAFNCLRNQRGQQHLKQQPKTAPDTAPNCMPLAPAGSLGKLRPHLKQHHPQNSTCISAPNCMQPSIWQKCAYTVTSTSNNTPEQQLRQHHHAPVAPAVKLAKQHLTSTPNCMPPSTRPSLSQNSTSTGTPSWMPPSTRPSSSQNSIHQVPQTACWHPAVNLAKRRLHQQPKLDAP